MKTQLIEILDKLIDLGDNHDRKPLMAIRHELLDFLKQDDHLLIPHTNESINTAVNAVHFVDAQVNLATSDNIKAGKNLQPFLEHLNTAEKWNYYELRFLVGSLNLTATLKESLVLAGKACELLKDFASTTPPTDRISAVISFNLTQRILYTKFFEENNEIDLEDAFQQWFLKLQFLASENDKLQLLFNVVEIRQAVFNQDRQQIAQLMQQFEANYNEKEIEVMAGEVNLYMASERYNQLYQKI